MGNTEAEQTHTLFPFSQGNSGVGQVRWNRGFGDSGKPS